MDVMILYLEWMQDAACRGSDEEAMFSPDLEGKPSGEALGALRREVSHREITAKVRHCSVCPVRLRCAEFGWKEEFGVYGGWSPGERRGMDDGTFRLTPIRSKRSPQRDKAAMLVREGLSINDTAVKMEMQPQSVVDYLRQVWVASITQSDNS